MMGLYIELQALDLQNRKKITETLGFLVCVGTEVEKRRRNLIGGFFSEEKEVLYLFFSGAVAKTHCLMK